MKVDDYKNLNCALPTVNRKWPLYGKGFESLGRDGFPIETGIPGIKADELLLRIDAVGLCFSDIKVINLGNSHSRLLDRDMVENPVVLGHETCVTVVKVGESLKKRFKPAERYILQPDVYYKGKPVTIGYSREGALQQYMVVGSEVLEGDEGCYLLEANRDGSYAESALCEPWSCVETTYGTKYRDSLKNGGIAWFIGAEDAKFDEYGMSDILDAGKHPGKIIITNVRGKISEILAEKAANLGFDVMAADNIQEFTQFINMNTSGKGFDDIVILGTPDAELMEKVVPVLATGGICAIISDKPMNGKVYIDVGRVHYDGIYFTGTASTDVSKAYSQTRFSEIKAHGTMWINGAGGPLGQMHVQRAAAKSDGPKIIVATDIDTVRLDEVKSKFNNLAEARGASLITYNPADFSEQEFDEILDKASPDGKFDDIIILAPLPELVEKGFRRLSEGGILNIFAGIAKATTIMLDLSGFYLRGRRLIGSSGTSISAMLDTIKKVKNSNISPDYSVAAIGGLNSAAEGLKAVKAGSFPGKVVIYPQLTGLPLIPLKELHNLLPGVAAKLKDGKFWTKEAEDELLNSQWADSTVKVRALQCTGTNELKLEKFDLPEPADDCAVLKVRLCGVCGSDLHGIEGKRSIKFPFIPGHEIVAEVHSLGKNAGKSIKVFGGDSLKIGDRVVVNPRIACGKCYYCTEFPSRQQMCLNTITSTRIGSGTSPYLFGGWADYIYMLPRSEVIRLPESLPDELAVLAEPYTCAVGCIDRYKSEHTWASGDAFSINDAVVVYGVGAVGMLMAAGFHLAGARRIIAVDTDPGRLALSFEFGATHVINVTEYDADERVHKIRELTDGLGAGVAIEACGVPDVINEAVKALRRGGKLFEAGHAFNAGMAEIDPYIICRNEIEILGCYAYPSSNSMLQAVRLLDEHKLPYEKLTKFFSLEAYEDVIFKKKTSGAIKPVFRI